MARALAQQPDKRRRDRSATSAASWPSTVKEGNQLLRSDEPVRVLDDGGNFVPVDIDIEPHSEPPARSDIRRSVEPRGVLLDHRLLHAGRSRRPEADDAVVVMIVREHAEDLAAEPRRLAVAQLLGRLGKRQASLPQPLDRVARFRHTAILTWPAAARPCTRRA